MPATFAYRITADNTRTRGALGIGAPVVFWGIVPGAQSPPELAIAAFRERYETLGPPPIVRALHVWNAERDSPRIVDTWYTRDGRPIAIGDLVRCPNGITGVVTWIAGMGHAHVRVWLPLGEYIEPHYADNLQVTKPRTADDVPLYDF